MNRLLVLSLALASIFGVNAKQMGTVAAATVSEAEVVAPMSQRIPEVKAADPAREISFGYAKAQAKAAGLKEVSAPAKAFYTRQKGMTYCGMSAGSYALSYSRMHVLPYQDFTLRSISTDANSLKWTVSDGITYDEEGYMNGWTTKTFTGESVTWRHDEMASVHLCPTLEASNALGDSTYQAADYIANLPEITSSQDGVGDFYKTNLNPTADIVAYWGVSACNSEDANARLVSNYGLSEEKGYTDVHLYGLSEVFYYPGKPYLLTDVAAFVCDLARNGNLKAKLEIYKVSFDEDDNLQFGELLTTATNDPTLITSGRQFQCVVFNDLVYTDPETQRTTDLVIDSDILVVVKPADTTSSYASYIWATTEDYPAKIADLWNDFTTAYLLAGAKYNGSNVVIPISGSAAFYHDDAKTQLDVQRAFAIEINAHYYYLHTEDNAFDAPVEGGSKTITFDSWYAAGAWDVMTADEDDVPEWISISAKDLQEDGGYTGVTEVTFEVEALPEGVEGRACDVVLSYYGASATIHITQGNNEDPKPDPEPEPEPEQDPDTDLSQFDNVLFVQGNEGFAGHSATLSLQMNNIIEAVGFQCDLYLPEGTSIPEDEDGFYMISLSEERTTSKRTNTFDFAKQKDGAIRILASSTKSLPFTGNSGEVATIELNIDNSIAEGKYPLVLKNIVISDANGSTYKVDRVKTTLVVNDYIIGDANEDTDVNIGDYTTISNYILGWNPQPFNIKAADVNADGDIDVGDLASLVKLILSEDETQNAQATKRIDTKATDITGMDNVIYGVDTTIGEDGSAYMSVRLKNSVSVPGFQFDLVIPEGFEVEKDEDGYYLIELSNERTTSKKTNLFESALQKNGMIRVLCSSSKSIPFTGNDGEVCTIKLRMKENVEIGEYNATIKNIVVSDIDGKTFKTDSTDAKVIVTNESSVEMINQDTLGDAVIYSVDGIMRRELQPGVNIIRYENNVVKKVIIK